MGKLVLILVVVLGGLGWLAYDYFANRIEFYCADCRGYRGRTAHPLGDIDLDGHPDIAVSIDETTELYILYGGENGVSRQEIVPLPEVLTEVEPFSVSGLVVDAGDIDGDGMPDLVFCPREDGNERSIFFVYYATGEGFAEPGKTDRVMLPMYGDNSGQSLALTDVNADGFSDVVMAIPSWDGERGENAGRVDVYHGSAIGLFTAPKFTAEGLSENAALGTSIAAAGDVNGDGFEDVVMGAPGETVDNLEAAGVYRLHLGSQVGLRFKPAWGLTGRTKHGKCGTMVTALGDMNQDGYTDVMVLDDAPLRQGAEGEAVHLETLLVYKGGPKGLDLQPSVKLPGPGDDFYGQAVAVGDFNADGFIDAAIGMPDPEPRPGQAARPPHVLWHLGTGGGFAAQPEVLLAGEQDAGFGATLCAADLDADGGADLLVGVRAGNPPQQVVRHFRGGAGFPVGK